MKTPIYILTGLFLASFTHAQNCSQNLEDAKRAYYNGQFREVETTLDGCLDQLSKEEQVEAFKLLTDTYLVLGEADVADTYISELLSVDPTFEPRQSDLVEFRNLFNQYRIRTRYTIGIMAGLTRPDYLILSHRSYASDVQEPSDYQEKPGISLGFTGDYRLIGDLYLNWALMWDWNSFEQEEIILGHQRVYSRERYQWLSLPIQIRYIYTLGPINLTAGGGFVVQYMLSARAELDHSPLPPEFPKDRIGIPVEADNYNLRDQRNCWSGAWLVSGGIQHNFGNTIVELRFTYRHGISNLVDEDMRYRDRQLVDDFAYVPDNFKINTYLLSLVVLRDFAKPEKR